MVGSQIAGRYRLDVELGRGGMGVVYKAHDTILKRDVAVKLLSATALGTEGRARLMKEARATARLNHPNIVAVHDAGESEAAGHGKPLPYIVMELLDGPTLHERRPDSLEENLQITRQLCAALEHAHDNLIIHRDLKPENIMLARDGTVKLMDFGLARSLTTRMTAEGTIMGTLFYMAPEMVMGQEVDGRADLYALGVLIYEMTTGRLPFEADDPVAVLTQHLHAPVVPPTAHNPQLLPALDHLIVRLLAKKPNQRPASATEVLKTLDEIIQSQTSGTESHSIPTLDRLIRGRLVGRQQELAEARAIWGETVAGRGRVLLVSGEPGIGKTRLMEELITQASISGGKVLTGASYAEGGVPFSPFRQILVEAFRNDELDLSEDLLADLLILAPELQAHHPAPPDRTPGDPLEQQQRLLGNVGLYFSLLSKQAPVLLVLEDAHWADSATISLMRYLARNCPRLNLMLAVTYREVEIDEARSFHEALLDLQRERLTTRIKLSRLDRAGTKALLATLFDDEITPEFLDSIYRETEGNPFFIEEISKALVESGQLTFNHGRWNRPPIEELGIPQSIRVAIQARASALSQDSLKILEQAAVLGRFFDLPTLKVATGQDEDALIDALEEALTAQLIEDTGEVEGSFSFVHALIPTSLVAGFRTLRRRQLQRRAAIAFEAVHPNDYEVLANLFLEAGQLEKGAHYLLQAGDRARAQYAHEEAIASYQAAVDYFKESGQLESSARTLMKLGLAFNNAFDFARSRQAYQEGFALWQQISTGSSAKLPKAPHALRVPWAEPTSLDPGLATDSPSTYYIDQLFCGLVQLTPELDVMPDLASSWKVLDGGRRYRFRLRDDVYWSDGVQVTALDFAYAWRRVLSPHKSRNAEALFTIKNGRDFHEGEVTAWDDVGVHVVDPLTLEVTLEQPDFTFLYLMSTHVAFAVPEHHRRERGISIHTAPWMAWQEMVTNGPFRLVEWKPNEMLLLETNPRYHGSRSGNVESVEIRIYRFDHEDKKRLVDYEADRLDMTIPPNSHAIQARNRFAGDQLSLPQSRTTYLSFDTKKGPFADPRVRRALGLAIDKERLSEVTSGGFDMPATGGFVPPGIPGHVEGIALPYDPEAARQLLVESGYGERGAFPTLELPHAPWSTRQSEYVTTRWREVLGIEIEAVRLSWSTLLERLNTDPPAIHILGLSPWFHDPDEFLGGTEEFIFRTGWRNESYVRLVQQAREMMDQSGRMALYQQAERILVDESPIIPLYYHQWNLLVKPWVRRFPASSLKFWFWKDVVIEPH